MKRHFVTNTSIILLLSASVTYSKPNNPPECDPNSPEFAQAAENSVIIVVPGADFEHLGVVLSGCERAKQFQISNGSATHNCVVIRSEDLDTATEVIARENVQLQGIMTDFQNFDSNKLQSVAGQINGRIVIKPQPWENAYSADQESLIQHGYSGYNMLRSFAKP